jgi:pimeloyl-ACP methyl ester carboxylesterase
MEITEKKFEGINYRCYKTTTDNGHFLIFLHGFSGNSSIWNDFIPIFQNKFNMIFIDLSGHGKSETPENINGYFFSSQANKIFRIFEQEKVNSVTLISYSYSCYISLELNKILKNKIRSIVFVSPYLRDKFNFVENQIFKFIGFIWKYLIANRKYDLDYRKLKNYEKPTFGETRYTLKCINTKDLLGSLYALKNSEKTILSGDIKTPLLVIYGEHDKMMLPEIKIHFHSLETAKVKVICNKKHLFLKTHSLEIANSIKSFMTEHSFQ